MQRRHFVLSCSAAALALAQPLARAQGLADRATILAGFAPGGTVDVTAAGWPTSCATCWPGR